MVEHTRKKNQRKDVGQQKLKAENDIFSQPLPTTARFEGFKACL
jgi:hypothetical protein